MMVTANAITTYFAIPLDILDPATSKLKFRAEICFKLVKKIVFSFVKHTVLAQKHNYLALSIYFC